MDNTKSEIINRKFIEQLDVSELEVLTDSGYKPIISTNKTIEYIVYEVVLSNGYFLKCADDHIVFDEYFTEVFVKDLIIGQAIQTDVGLIKVTSVKNLDYSENMYDLSVDSNDHRFYTNGILSHNTTCVAAYLCWYLIFNDAKNVAILANKLASAQEVMDRLQEMYMGLPKFIQAGVVDWNKRSFKLANKSKAFTAATTASGIRGKSCVTDDTRVCVQTNNSDFFYTQISYLLNNDIETNSNEHMKFTVYKTTNIINDKIYVGFHSVKTEEDILRIERGNLSCFSDGYLGSGKLMLAALEKYGPENFDQEILGVFDTKEDAESLEREIVNKNFVNEDTNYNLSVGGNVCILYGENNGFYGERHTKEILDKIQESRKKSKLPTYQCIGIDVDTQKQFKGYREILDYYGFIKPEKAPENATRLFIGKLCHEGTLVLDRKDFMESTTAYYIDHLAINSEERKAERKELLRKSCSERFSGNPISEYQKEKLLEGHKRWKKENPELHYERMMKINKNPEKIRKMAEKHRGMKRSDETKRKLSEAAKGKSCKYKGMFQIENVETKERIFIKKEDIIPDGWVKFVPIRKNHVPRKSYTNGEIYKLFVPGMEPEGWWMEGKPKK
jgi:hypothetical protein